MAALSTTIISETPNYKFKKLNINKVIDTTTILSFIAPIGFVINKITTYPQGGGVEISTQGDYILMLTSCLLGLLAAHLPLLLNRFLKIEIPSSLRVMFSVFLFCAIFLGEVMSFYYLVPHWDDILHLGSGIMTGFFGVLLLSNFCKSNQAINLPLVAVTLFAFCFALSVGGVWEIFEYAMDSLLGLNMQKTMVQSGQMLSGHLAVADTMKDIIVDACGATIASVVSYLLLKYPNINISQTFRKQLTNNCKVI